MSRAKSCTPELVSAASIRLSDKRSIYHHTSDRRSVVNDNRQVYNNNHVPYYNYATSGTNVPVLPVSGCQVWLPWLPLLCKLIRLLFLFCGTYYIYHTILSLVGRDHDS